jgi:hypothetical protein
MADFRKCIPVLAVLALFLGLTTTASAQNAFTCVAGVANPAYLRSEGLTELVGDLVITCRGGVPTAPGAYIPRANISVFMGFTTVTSRLLDTTTGASEALLMLDDPLPASGPNADLVKNNPQTLCPNPTFGCVNLGNGSGGFVPSGNPNQPLNPPQFNYYGTGSTTSGVSNYNIFQGLIMPSQPNAVTWLGVPIDPPGTNGERTIRITNIRINANALGVGTETSPPVQAIAFLSVTPTTALPITNNAQQVVGNVLRSLSVSVKDPAARYVQCVSQKCSVAATILFDERFPSAFKRRLGFSADGFQDTPGSTIWGSESGFTSAVTGSVVGYADFGTRLKAVFNNVPSGVTLKVPTYITGPLGGLAVLVADETSPLGSFSASGPVDCLAGTNVSTVTLTAGSGKAVYEVIVEGQQYFDEFQLPVFVTYTADPGNGSPSLGTATVNGWYAPTPPVFDATKGRSAQGSDYKIPRFVDLSTALNIFTINVCATNLLFPFVTNQVGFDTGLAIANTSLDAPVFATSPQTGTCTLYAYGDNAPAAVVSPTVAAGKVWTALASAAMPNFQGYVIARCTFQYAHGFAFVSDLGARNLAMGYLALVIPDTSSRSPSLTGTTNIQGEQLNN